VLAHSRGRQALAQRVKPCRIFIKSNSASEQWGIISNGVKDKALVNQGFWRDIKNFE
jgi:hypothetical protein